jgi:hypothetical protein
VPQCPGVLRGAAQLDTPRDLRDSVDEREQAEQQRERDRAGAGEQHDAEGDRDDAGLKQCKNS